jgi:hypothetical protein
MHYVISSQFFFRRGLIARRLSQSFTIDAGRCWAMLGDVRLQIFHNQFAGAFTPTLELQSSHDWARNSAQDTVSQGKEYM